MAATIGRLLAELARLVHDNPATADYAVYLASKGPDEPWEGLKVVNESHTMVTLLPRGENVDKKGKRIW